jgi:hypothetical protein
LEGQRAQGYVSFAENSDGLNVFSASSRGLAAEDGGVRRNLADDVRTGAALASVSEL